MKTIKIFIAILLVLSVFFAACSSNVEKASDSDSMALNDANDNNVKTSAVGGKLKDFLGKGLAYECNYELNTPEGTLRQVVQLDSKNMRAEITDSNTPGKTVIVGTLEGKQQCSLMWSEGMPSKGDELLDNQVIKVCFEASEDESFTSDDMESGKGSFSTIDWNAKADCKPLVGSVDTSYPKGYELNEIELPSDSGAGDYATADYGNVADMGDPIPPESYQY